ncbi:permease [Opitutales bacterium ASA1]|uniref:permease n=1 Tax=Congregicoccus parvus TaxID=3081749 RepID=UPI002B2F8986|nr:permease [Opitutales bacterium ASA1]
MWSWAEWIADGIVEWTGWDRAHGAGAALHFFVYDLLKIVVLVATVAFVMALVRGALPMARLRAALDRPGGRVFGYPAAAVFGALTPFCSCSSVPVFLGFVQARFPIGVAFAFLITSPLVNEIAVALLGATFGWRFALAYAAAGIALGIVGGLGLTLLRAERWLTPGAMQPTDADDDEAPHGLRGRLLDAADTSLHILRKIAPWLLASLALGAGMHGFVPEGFFENLFADTGAWTVPLASLAGLPLYVSANATVPLLDAFVSKGVPLGTALAFLLSAVGVSLPELILLRSVMTVRLLASFATVVLLGTTLIGWLFNILRAAP